VERSDLGWDFVIETTKPLKEEFSMSAMLYGRQSKDPTYRAVPPQTDELNIN
jgi:hypothetical protein